MARELHITYLDKRKVIDADYSNGANAALRKYFKTDYVYYCYGTLSRGSSNMPMVFMVNSSGIEPEVKYSFEVRVWEKK